MLLTLKSRVFIESEDDCCCLVVVELADCELKPEVESCSDIPLGEQCSDTVVLVDIGGDGADVLKLKMFKNLFAEFCKKSDVFITVSVAYVLKDEASVARCLCVRFSGESPISSIGAYLTNLERNFKYIRVFANRSDGFGFPVFTCHFTPHRPSLHPSYMARDMNAVFHSLMEVVSTLSTVGFLQGVDELLHYAVQVEVPAKNNLRKHPFVVIEGLDGSGKSTLVKSLATVLDALVLEKPLIISKVSRQLIAFSDKTRKACFYLNNYMLAERCLKHDGPVVCDRFWHSSTAYAIAQDCLYGGVEAIPPKGHAVYEWPDDLLKPDLVIFLDPPNDIRESRVLGRGEAVTIEDVRLQRANYREKVREAYGRIAGVPMVTMDASPSREQLLETALSIIREANIEGCID